MIDLYPSELFLECEVPTEVKAAPALDVTHGCIMAAMLPAPHHSS